MIGTIALILSSVSLTAATLAIFWIYRCRGKKLQNMVSAFGAYGTAILAYALWHFFTHINVAEDSYSHLIIHNLFVISAAGMNVYYACKSKISLNVNRRKEQRKKYDSTTDRRKARSQPVIKK